MLDQVMVKTDRQIQTGDLLAWGYIDAKGFGRYVRGFVQMMTLSTYSHVGIAYVKDDILHVIEAVEPCISINRIDLEDTFYVVPMNISNTTNLEDIANDYVGKKYSLLDCVRGYLGVSTDDNNRWQCAELSTEIYRRLGHDIKPRRLTPQEVVQAALRYTTSASGLWVH